MLERCENAGSVVLLLLVVASVLGAQTVAPSGGLSSAEVAAAIEDGQTTRDLKPYRIGKKAILIRSDLAVEIGQAYPPYLRIALAARAAKDPFKTLSVFDVTREMSEALVYVNFTPQEPDRFPGVETPLETYVSLKTVLAMPKGTKDPAQAIRPVWIKESASVFAKMFGALDVWDSKGVVAAFPMQVLNPDFEFVATYADKVWMGDGEGDREIRGANVEETWK